MSTIMLLDNVACNNNIKARVIPDATINSLFSLEREK